MRRTRKIEKLINTEGTERIGTYLNKFVSRKLDSRFQESLMITRYEASDSQAR